MAVINRITEQEYRDLALEEPRLELWDGEPREKPTMSMKHEGVAFYLGHSLATQLDRGLFWISVNGGKARISGSTYFIPDVMVVQAELVTPYRDDPRALAAWSEPLLLVVEVWSPSTDGYDQARKLNAYKERGDQEIWYIHPYERTLTAWRKQPDGSYHEAVYAGGVVPAEALPGVVIDLDELLS
ncbi:MAG: Uma2 family endonuclease [Chloroflexota bacterium]|nr:Uma2 family endonuclease [Chloroflexota bacterium]